MRDSCHILKVLNKTTKEENWRRIYHVCWFNHQFTAFYYFLTTQISPGPLVIQVLAYIAPSWYTQGLACGEGFWWDVERIRNTDLFSQFMEQASFIQRGRPITICFSFSFFWDLKIDDSYGAVQIISFTRNDCYMDTNLTQDLINFKILHSYVLPQNVKYFVLYRQTKFKEGSWKALCLCSCIFWLLFWLKPQLSFLESCSVHISEFMMQRLGLCTKCELLICNMSL